MLVRPSLNNMHEFFAEENSCFFDICLPNYMTEGTRRITYFKALESIFNCQDSSKLLEVQYDTTPPRLPHNFEVAEVSYKGELM